MSGRSTSSRSREKGSSPRSKSAVRWLLRLALAAAAGTIPRPLHAQAPEVHAVAGVWRGTWKLTVLARGADDLLLVEAKAKGIHLAGDVLKSAPFLPEASVQQVDTERNRLRVVFLSQKDRFVFEGRTGGAGEFAGAYLGVVTRGDEVAPAVLAPSSREALLARDEALKNSLEVCLAEEAGRNRVQSLLAWTESHRGHPATVRATSVWLQDLGRAPLADPQVRPYVERALKSNEAFGPLWQREAAWQWLAALEGNAACTDVRRWLLAQIPEAPGPCWSLEKETRWSYWRWELAQGGKDPALEQAARDKWLELRGRLDQQDLAALWPFETTPLPAPRDPRPARAAVVEAFVSPHCDPSAAVETALEGLRRSAAASDCIVLLYPLHAGAGSPLVSAASLTRAAEVKVERTPTILVNGEPFPLAGPRAANVPALYEDLRRAAAAARTTPRAVETTLSVKRDGDLLSVAATANMAAGLSNLEGQSWRLRVAVADAHVRYEGRNGVRLHPFVVWDWAGGFEGAAFLDRQARQETIVDLARIRRKVAEYHDEYERRQHVLFSEEVDDSLLLHPWIVAYVIHPQTGEILHAAAQPAP